MSVRELFLTSPKGKKGNLSSTHFAVTVGTDCFFVCLASVVPMLRAQLCNLF